MLLLVMFGVLSAYQAYAIEDFEMTHYTEVCTGRDLLFPYYDNLMKTRKVFFTPESSPGSTRVVLDEGKILDPRFTYQMGAYAKISDVSMDYAGKYSVVLPGTDKMVNLMTLSVFECSKEKQVEYGGTYSFELPAVETIDYLPFNSSQMPVILWRRKVLESVGWTLRIPRFLDKLRLTQSDQGFYTLRDIVGGFVERFSISVKEIQQNHTLQAGEDISVNFPLDGVHFNLTRQPEDGISMPVTLMQDGRLVYSEAFEGRIELLSTGVKISKLKIQDGGTYKLHDDNGNLAMVVELRVVVEPQGLAGLGQ